MQTPLSLADRKPKWAGKTAGRSHRRGHARKPLILKVLAALRHVAKGHDYESLEAESGVSTSVLKTFIPAFLKWLACGAERRQGLRKRGGRGGGGGDCESGGGSGGDSGGGVGGVGGVGCAASCGASEGPG